jgi:K+-transporting ATPase ATPase C chain
MFKLTFQSIRQTIVWTLICGVCYPVLITLLCQLMFHNQANGSLIVRDGKVIGSGLLAQQFQGSNYFWPRPSACYYGSSASGIVASSGSNLGPTSGALQTNVKNNAAAFRSGNNLAANADVPVDMVFASASGLDPDISPASAELQVARVAASRGMPVDQVKRLVEQFVEPPQLGFLGQERVNVLKLNVALDAMKPAKL